MNLLREGHCSHGTVPKVVGLVGVVQSPLPGLTVGEISDDVFCLRIKGPPYMSNTSFFGTLRGWEQVPRYWFRRVCAICLRTVPVTLF